MSRAEIRIGDYLARVGALHGGPRGGRVEAYLSAVQRLREARRRGLPHLTARAARATERARAKLSPAERELAERGARAMRLHDQPPPTGAVLLGPAARRAGAGFNDTGDKQ